MADTLDAPVASPSQRAHLLAAQLICPNCRREDCAAIWGEPLRCEECHAGDAASAHVHAIYKNRRFESRTLTFDRFFDASAFADRHPRVGTFRFDMVVQCQCSLFTDLDDATLATIRRHDRDGVAS